MSKPQKGKSESIGRAARKRRKAPATASGPLARWERTKAEDPDRLVGLRNGNFIEFLDQDAAAVSRVLGIATRCLEFADGAHSFCAIPDGHQGEARLRLLKAAGHRVVVIASKQREGGKSNRTASKPKAPATPEPPWSSAWKNAKAANPEALVGMRMGAFVEFFDNHAETAANVLGIVLTRRRFGDREIPMCGFPAGWYAEQYVKRLRAAGHRVKIVGPRTSWRGSEARPLTRAEYKQLEASGELDRINRELAEREKIRRIASQLGEEWRQCDVADAENDVASVNARLSDIDVLEQDMAACTPHDAGDALALAVLLFDRLAAIEARVEGDVDAELHHGQAVKMAHSLVCWLAAEGNADLVAMGLKAYGRHLFKPPTSGGHHALPTE